jgi:hypothetical protein
MNTRELVDALIAGDSIAIENAFSNTMSHKVSSALDDYKIQVAEKIFNTEIEDPTDVDVTEV